MAYEGVQDMYGGAVSMICNIVRTGIRTTNRGRDLTPKAMPRALHSILLQGRK